MEIKLVGLHKTFMKRKGKVFGPYYYAWRGGPRIKATYGTLAFVREFEEAARERNAAKLPKGVFHSVIVTYKGSTEFKSLGDRTKADYLKHIKAIENTFGTLPLSAFKATNVKKTRGLLKKWRDGLHQRSLRQGDYAWTVLARICSVGADRGLIDENPCAKGGRKYKSSRQDLIWTPDDERKFYESAPPHISLAVLLAVWTGQRQGDLLKMRWTKGAPDEPYFDGTHMHLKQSKGQAYVRVKVVGPLKAALTEAKGEAVGPYILTTTKGAKWKSGFGSLFSKKKKDAGLGDLTFHDLRGTAITRLALAGATLPEISAVTGHTMRHVEEILAAHYLGGKVELADQAMIKLEQHWARAA
jgi:integrase